MVEVKNISQNIESILKEVKNLSGNAGRWALRSSLAAFLAAAGMATINLPAAQADGCQPVNAIANLENIMNATHPGVTGGCVANEYAPAPGLAEEVFQGGYAVWRADGLTFFSNFGNPTTFYVENSPYSVQQEYGTPPVPLLNQLGMTYPNPYTAYPQPQSYTTYPSPQYFPAPVPAMVCEQQQQGGQQQQICSNGSMQQQQH